MDKTFSYNPHKDAIEIAKQLARIADAVEWAAEEFVGLLKGEELPSHEWLEDTSNDDQ